jgi:[glutamine synthetase] adenylyltransferase / [glutamine synthetase]-adenylyl-L-tyrosine phosphorylase
MNYEDALNTCPQARRPAVEKHLARLIDSAQECAITLDTFSSDFIALIVRALAVSDYLAESLIKQPELLGSWVDANSQLYRGASEAEMNAQLLQSISEVGDDAGLMSVLRLFRREHQTRIIWRDLCGLADLNVTLAEVSALADVCIQQALEFLDTQLAAKHGEPLSRDGKRQRLVVLGMGKLGARELNVSSDVDLIFAFPESGETTHPKKPIDNHSYFTKLGQRLIQALDQITEDGFVFRVDMRLRPYGSSGALALNFAAFEDYFYTQGREWERFAMLKARAITGDKDDREHLIESIVRPFVFRRYPDFSSFEALREMKRLIMSEVHRKGGDQNIKLGAGGIREIEFIAQATQLIYGGRDRRLQDTGLQTAFHTIAEADYLPDAWVKTLLEVYTLLRNMEHAIQGFRDQQTQLLPSDDAGQAAMVYALAYDDWGALLADANSSRASVTEIFSEFLHEEAASDRAESEVDERWKHLWRTKDSAEQWLGALADAGFDDAEKSLNDLISLREHPRFRSMSGEARDRFELFLPRLLSKLSGTENASLTLHRVLQLVEAVLGRTIYLVLLNENDEALTQLCKLCSASQWFADHISNSPVVLDDLLTPETLYNPPQLKDLDDELRQLLLRIPEEDQEAQMDCLRNFKQSHMLRVAAAEITNALPVMKVSDYLTWLAEACVKAAMGIAWRAMEKKHGRPSTLEGADLAVTDLECAGFAVVGYGKLGGIELGYSSDLDMVFLYDADDFGSTNGDKAIDNQLFYARLGQRVVHILGAQTSQGRVYEVDMRLRPSGNSGMLVSSISAFEKYQLNDAWTWEHQALVRARFIGGDSSLAEKFAAVRARVLSAPRDADKLRQEVIGMRDKMRDAANEKYKSHLLADQNLKQGRGGLIDIEFVTQYLVLANAEKHPEILRWTDNVRLLEALAELDGMPCDLVLIIDAYRALRSAMHLKSLSGISYPEGLNGFPEERQSVVDVFAKVFKL